jgi:hypothetical protein
MFATTTKNLRAYTNESWIYEFRFKSNSPKSYTKTPYNFSAHFVLMHIYDITGGILASSYAKDTSAVGYPATSSLVNSSSGIAVINFPYSAVSGISAGMYNYRLYFTDYPVLASASYVVCVLRGPFNVEGT